MNNEVLQEIFTKQAELNKRCGMDYTQCKNDGQIKDWCLKYGVALSQELAELYDWIQYKHWRQYDTPIDRHQAKIEIVDMLHFLVSLALPFMTADELVDLYHNKCSVNHHRQDSIYNDEYEQKFKQPGKEDNDMLKDPYHVDCKRCGGTGVITKVVGAQQMEGYPPVIGCHMETDTCPDCFQKRIEMIGKKMKDEGNLPPFDYNVKSWQVCQICHGTGCVQDSDCNCNIECDACGGNGYV